MQNHKHPNPVYYLFKYILNYSMDYYIKVLILNVLTVQLKKCRKLRVKIDYFISIVYSFFM